MKTNHVSELIDEYIDGTLDNVQRVTVELHLVECAECRQEFDEVRSLVGALGDTPRAIEAPDDLKRDIEAALEHRRLANTMHRDNGMDRGAVRHEATNRAFMYRIAATILIGLVSASMLWFVLKDGDELPVLESNAEIKESAPPVVEKKSEVDSVVKERGSRKESAQSSSPRAVAKGDSRLDRTNKAKPADDPRKDVQDDVLAKAEYGGIVGRVVDARTGKRMAGVTIQVDRTGKLATTDHLGLFRIDSVVVGSHSLSAASKEYGGHSGSVDVQPGSFALFDVKLESVIDKQNQTMAHGTPKVTTESMNGSVAGKVVDAHSGSPIVGANILIVGSGRGGVSDSAGSFTIRNIPPGKYIARVSSVGYQVVELAHIQIESKSEKLVAAALQAEDIQLEGVTVEAAQPLVSKNSTNSVRVNPSQSDQKPKGVEDVLGLQAGVTKFGGQGFTRGGRTQDEMDGGRDVRYDGLNTEQYDHVGENEFKETLGNPLSTFSIDVDNASYSNIRRFITNGQLPPPGAVRIEEMINYFSYDYPQPKREHPFSVNMELAECPWNADNKLMLIGLQGKQIATADLPPSNLVFLIDVSGSMQPENKLPLVRRSFKLLVDQLRPVDRVAIAVYAGSAGLVLPSTSGRDKQTILDAIDRLEAGGSTAGGAGINLAYSVAKEHFLEEGNNRVILATDGDFNVGVTNDDELVRLIEEKRKDGIFLSILGFGFGNLKDSRMEKIADKGNGNYAYIDNIHEARKVLVSQLAGTLYTIAKDVKLQIEFNPANVKAYRLIGYENRILNKEDFNDDRKDAGDMGAGHSVTALYEIVPADADIELSNVDSLKYSQFSARTNSSTSGELATVKLRYKHPADLTSKLMVQPLQNRTVSLSAASMNLRFAAAVAQFGMLLRESKFKGDSSFESILTLAKRAKGEDENGYRSEFIQLVETAKDLKRR